MIYEEIEIAGERMSLLPEKAIYWQSRHVLFIADLHIGKVSHFRKNGIPVPMQASTSNKNRLFLLLDSLDVREVIFLGDLFHSDYNDEWQILEELVSRYSDISFHLVVGNHDILQDKLYESTRLVLHRGVWHLGPFALSHEPDSETAGYNLCGHIHPGIHLRGRGRQSLRLPCFYFDDNQGILPAFGAFTGLYNLQATKTSQVYVIGDNKVIKV